MSEPQQARHLELDASHEVVIRPVTSDDETELHEFLARLTPATLRLRFFIPVRHPERNWVARLLSSDGDGRFAVAARLAGKEIVGIAELERTSESEAEVAFVVDDRFRHHGIATASLHELAAFARARGVTGLTADVLAENHGMTDVFTHGGYPLTISSEGDVLHFRMDIRRPPEPAVPAPAVSFSSSCQAMMPGPAIP